LAKKIRDKIFGEMQKQCGKSFEGEVKEGAAANDTFGIKLVMHVLVQMRTRFEFRFFFVEMTNRGQVLTYKMTVFN
jgi:hypothetical protein